MTKWLSLDSAAAYIDARDTTVLREAIKRGDLRAYRFGEKSFRLTTEDIDTWLKLREAQ